MPSRSQLISFSADKVLRIWNVPLQVCIQRISNVFPKGPEVSDVTCWFDELANRLFISFRYTLLMMEIKPEVTNRVQTHDQSVVSVRYNKISNQVKVKEYKKISTYSIIIWNRFGRPVRTLIWNLMKFLRLCSPRSTLFINVFTLDTSRHWNTKKSCVLCLNTTHKHKTQKHKIFCVFNFYNVANLFKKTYL